MTDWNRETLFNKGYDANGRKVKADGLTRVNKPAGKKIKTTSKEKSFIEWALMAAKIPFVKEHRFDTERRFRFDFAWIDKKIAWEYDGLALNSNKATSSGKSRHTSPVGFALDQTKTNLATMAGWRVFRYCALNHGQIVEDLKQIMI